MPTLKKISWAIGAGIAISLVTAIVGFLSAAHLEISFDKLKSFDPTDLKSYKLLGTSVKFDFELSQQREFIAYWIEEEERPIVHRGDMNFNNFKLTSSIRGEIVEKIGSETIPFRIVGYYNSGRLVFSHRGPVHGVGVYILSSFEVGKVMVEAYAGYAIVETVKEGSQNVVSLLQCPFIMIERGEGEKEYPTVEKAQEAFPLLKTQCVEFKAPRHV
jgi:hypothetical protein